MKKVFFFFGLLSFTTGGLAQSYSSPESVERNHPDGNHFIANTGDGKVLKLLPDGTLQNFASGLSSGPYGLELVGDTLYACNGGALTLINRNTGAVIQNVSLGATFLNGITHKGKNLYITDFSAKKIYRFNTKTNAYNIFVNSLSKTPNGIIYDYLNDRLVFACWDSSAPIYAVNLTDSTTSLLTTTSVGNIDGISMDCQGDFYISCWSPNSIRKYNETFSSSSVVATAGISSPADIFYDKYLDTLFVPNSGAANNVVELYTPACLTTGMTETQDMARVNVFPNPSEGMYTLAGLTGPSEISVTDLSGQVVLQNSVSSSIVSIDLSHIKPGIYLVRIHSGKGVQTHKISRQ